MADVPGAKRGGQEADDDSPQQNEGYDQAVNGDVGYEDAYEEIRKDENHGHDTVDDRAADQAAAEVRRRDRSAGG